MKNCKVFLVLIFALVLGGAWLAPAVLAQNEKIDLTMTLLPNGYYNQVKAGQDNALFLEVRNIGTKTVTNIRLSAEVPQGWTVEFKPSVIDSLNAGSVQTVDVNIKPVRGPANGDNWLTVIAQANEIKKVAGFPLGVTPGPASYWAWIGGALGIIIIIVFAVIFIRLNRQK